MSARLVSCRSHHFAQLAHDSTGNSKNIENWRHLRRAPIASMASWDHILSWPDVVCAIKKLSSGKCPGKDGIAPEILKLIIGEEGSENNSLPQSNFGKALWNVMGRVWISGKIPMDWCCSLVVPIPKKGDLHNMNNFRGISLISCVGQDSLSCDTGQDQPVH